MIKLETKDLVLKKAEFTDWKAIYKNLWMHEKLKEEKHGELALNIRCIKKAFKVRFENIFISVDDGTGKRMSEENEKW